MKLHFTDEWLRKRIAADPDADFEAGPTLTANNFASLMRLLRKIVRRQR